MRRVSLRRSIERFIKPAIESVETRVLLSTFTVTNVRDDGSTGSLRWAIERSNASAGSNNTIDFDISASPNVQTIVLTSALPAVTVPLTIDGTSEPGYTTTPLIELDGASAGKVAGLDLQAGNSTVKGLAINRFGAQGIILEDAGNDTIENNFIGTDPTGTIAEGNGSDGVIVDINSNFNTIQDNLISGNAGNGVYLNGYLFAVPNPTTTGNVVSGNSIGTDVTGTKVLGNVKDGLYVLDAPETTIGGPTAADRNLISGNGNGMELYQNSDNSVIEGNYIGTDVTGTVALGNGPNGVVAGDGIVLKGISNSVIGGTAAGEGNVISGNLDKGIDSFVIGSGNLVIEGNFIGTDATGTKALGNGSDGVYIAGETNVTIGGTVPGSGNVISANTGDGINTFAGNPGLVIQGNFIGTDVTGIHPLGNGGDGVHATYANITIGGLATGAGNVIANNGFRATFDHSGVVATNNDITILSNSISNNDNLGIELDGNANNALPAPVLNAASANSTGSTISGTIPAAAGTYTVQFFATQGLNSAGHAEGRTFLGTLPVTTSAASGSFTATFPTTFPAGFLITATLTDAAGDTSQFSLPFTATGTGTGLGAPRIVGSSSPASVLAGQTITDTFLVSNPDVADDAGVIFSDAIPAGTTFVSGTTSIGVPVVLSNGVATANIGALQAGETVRVTILLSTANVTGSSFVNTAYVSATTPAVAAGTDGVSITNNVTPVTDLAVTIAPTTPVGTGQQIQYVVTVTNNGPSDATGVVLTDALPNNVSGISFQSSSGSGSILGGILTQDFGNLASGASATLTIVATATATSVPSVTDSASVTGNEKDPKSSNNTASATTTVSPSADLAVAIAGPASSTPIGQNVTFVVTVTNNGPSNATGVVLTDTLPGGVNYVSASPSSGATAVFSNGTITENFGNLASGSTATLTIVVTPSASAVPKVTDTAQVTANEPDANAQNNSAQAQAAIVPATDLAVALTGPSGSTLAGQDLTYVATVTNNGPSDATGVVLTDTLPGNATFVSAIPSVGTGVVPTSGVITENFGNLASGASVTLTIVVTPNASAVPAVVDQASVTGNETDLVTTNNTASLTSTIAPAADLSVTISGPTDPTPVGQQMTYVVTVTNEGVSAATDATVTNTLPDGVTFVSATPSAGPAASETGGLVTDDFGSLAAGASATLTIVASPTPGAGSSVTDHATVSANEADPVTSNNTAAATSSVTPATDLAVLVTSSVPTIGVGGTLSYQVTVTNNGPSDATGVVLTNTLPANVSDVSATASPGQDPSVSGGVVSDTIDQLAAGSSVVITINVTPTADAPPAISDSASVSGNEFDADKLNNTAVAATTVTPVADLAMSLSEPSGNIFMNEDLTYTAVITNQGPSPATNVQFTAPLPPGTRFVSVTSNQASGTDDNGVATLALGTLDAGASATVTLTIIPSQAGTVSSTAYVTAAEEDPNATDNTASTDTRVVSPTSLIAFSAPSYTVNENAGYATITIVRLTGIDRDVTVHFTTTSGGRATAGVDYRPSQATVHFPAGAVRETVKVPVLANPYDNHDETVVLRLDSPTGDGILHAGTPGGAAPAYAMLVIKDVNPVRVGPTVTDVTLSGPVNSITSITVHTTGDLNPATANNTANYTLIALGGAGRGGLPAGTVIPVQSASYNAALNAITLTPRVPLPGGELFQIVVNGTRPGAVSDRAGNPLNSILGTRPGSNYALTFERGTRISYTDEHGTPVVLNLNGPGTLDIDREPSGRVDRLQVVGAVAGKTVISGFVPPRRSTTIGSILGLGRFGSISLRMYTPPFYVTHTVYPNPQSLMDAPAVDTLTAAPTGTPGLGVKPHAVAAHPHAGAAGWIRHRFRP